MSEPSAGVKRCECGCGEPVSLAKKDIRYRQGHASRGRTVSAKTRARMSAAARRGAAQPNWQGDDVGYQALHRYLRDNFPKSGVCDECAADPVRTEWALIHGRSYTRDIHDYRELCRRCHLRYDGQLKLDDALVGILREMRAGGATLGRIAAEHAISIRTVARALKSATP
jgi:hypothetical protein